MADKTFAPVRRVEVPGTGVKLQIEINRTTGEFSATYAGNRYFGEKRSLEEFVEYMTDVVHRALDTEWTAVILVRLADSGEQIRYDEVVGFHAERLRLGYINGKWKSLPWSAEPGPEAMGDSKDWPHFQLRQYDAELGGFSVSPDKLQLPYAVHNPHGYAWGPSGPPLSAARWIVAPYDEALWAGLQMLHERIKALRVQLTDMLGTRASLGMIAQVGAQALNLLPAPSAGGAAYDPRAAGGIGYDGGPGPGPGE